MFGYSDCDNIVQEAFHMFGFFKSHPYSDPVLGQFTRKAGAWHGHVAFPLRGEKPLSLSGNRSQPDEKAVRLAQQLPAQYQSLLSDIQKALFEHYEPYLQAFEAGEYKPEGVFPRLKNDSALWDHVRLVEISITSDRDGATTEIAYETDWDEEHTVGARIRDGRLVELNGSI